MYNHGQVGDDLFLCAFLLPLVTGNFLCCRFFRLRCGDRHWLFRLLAEHAQLLGTIFHGRYAYPLAFPAEVHPLQILKHLRNVCNTIFQRGDVLGNIRTDPGEIRPLHTHTSRRFSQYIFDTRRQESFWKITIFQGLYTTSFGSGKRFCPIASPSNRRWYCGAVSVSTSFASRGHW